MERYERWCFFLCCGATDGWMILDALLGKCPQKRKVSMLSKWHIPFHKMEVWEDQTCGILRNHSRVVEKLRFFHMLHRDVFAPTCLYCFAFVAVGWYLWIGGKTNILLQKCWFKKNAFKHSISSNSLGQERSFLWCLFFWGVVLFCKLIFSPFFNTCWAFCIITLHFTVRFGVPMRKKWKNRSSYIRWQILHRDIKPANILLFEQVRRLVGPLGSPTYFCGGLLSSKIFGGVVLLFSCDSDSVLWSVSDSDTVDGRNPAPPGMYKTLVNHVIKLPINWCRISAINSPYLKLLALLRWNNASRFRSRSRAGIEAHLSRVDYLASIHGSSKHPYCGSLTTRESSESKEVVL